MKKTSTGIVQEPLFPEYMFTTKISLNAEQSQEAMRIEAASPKQMEHWGWHRRGLSLSDPAKKIARLAYTRYYEVLSGNYGIPDGAEPNTLRIIHDDNVSDLQPRTKSAFTMNIKPGHTCVLDKHRCVHRIVCFVKTDLNGHVIKIKRKDIPQAHDCIVGPSERIIAPDLGKVLIVPASYDLEVTPRSSDDSTMLLVMNMKMGQPSH